MEVSTYGDSLVDLLKDPKLNSDKVKIQKLFHIIKATKDRKLKRVCLNGFQNLRDLEHIAQRLDNWEFKTLEYHLVDGIYVSTVGDESSSNDTMNLKNEQDLVERQFFQKELASKVLKTCMELYEQLNELNGAVERINEFLLEMSPSEYISDLGTILAQLTFRCLRLQKSLEYKLHIKYCKSKLVVIGIDLERIMALNLNESLTEKTVLGYRSYITDLLKQVEDCILNNDTIGTMECLSVVKDVERMFDAVKPKEYLYPIDSVSSGAGVEHHPKNHLKNRERSNSSFDALSEKSMSSLQRSTISEELPYLMSAFDDAKMAQVELLGVVSANTNAVNNQLLHHTGDSSVVHFPSTEMSHTMNDLKRINLLNQSLTPRTKMESSILKSISLRSEVVDLPNYGNHQSTLPLGSNMLRMWNPTLLKRNTSKSENEEVD
ncbi:BA75_03337T0 [Komagataella pastoris]|uniref:BA75_03337T0 n=1 Tax=Komagataella pastoris TaxID=4922 RepID=A0A1B2JGR0_PICPA|nr:BA75_03337T0 [Komagataella pastoris]